MVRTAWKVSEKDQRAKLNGKNQILLFAWPVQPDAAMCAPAFKTGLLDLTVKDGEPINLTCSITGDPEPQVEWFKDGEVSSEICEKNDGIYFHSWAILMNLSKSSC